jgi:superfamily II DNA or RNA helicase
MKKIILDVKNQYTTIIGATRETIRTLQNVTSFLVSGAYFSRAFRERRWDGRKKLLKYSDSLGYFFPTGLLQDVIDQLKKSEIKFDLKLNKRRSKPTEATYYAWNSKIKLRPYQLKAFRTICKGPYRENPFYGSGILKMPIRSGKTKTVAHIICHLAVRSLVIVPSKLLLYQTQKALSEALLCDVGIIGDSQWDERNVTVATAQTLSSARMGKEQRFADLVSRFDCVVFDEAHHLTAETWHDTMMAFDAPYKIGLSATAFPSHEREWEKGAIWLKACCGNIRVDIDTSELIKFGYLLGPQVLIYKIKKPKNLFEDGWSKELRNAAIYENKFRNKLITKISKKYSDKNLLTLVVTNRLNQVRLLSRLFEKNKILFHTITSEDNAQTRIDKIKSFTDRHVTALIGTVLSEGIDIPEIDVVINAEGGSNIKSTIQRMRNLTISEGKKEAIVVDFADLTNPYFARHSKERISVYKSEKAFRVRYEKIND